MVKSDFLELRSEGLYCPYGKFYIDPQVGVKDAVVSHAHADHAVAGNINVYCTAFTQSVMQLRYKKQSAQSFNVVSFFEKFELNGIEITFYPAGHILGSAMILLEHEGIKYLYTGDYKLQTDETCEQLVVPQANVLITESTFANPNTKHPSADEEIKKLNTIDSNILLGVYGLGKAQRITTLINQYCPEKTVHVHYSIYPIHQLYKQFGRDLGKYELYNRKSLKQAVTNQVYLVPPMTFRSYRGARGVAKVFASGWDDLQRGNDLSLYISDHVDWDDILTTVDKVQPNQVWTLHGDGKQLQAYFKNKLEVVIL